LIELLQRRNELILNSAGEGILGLDSDCRVTFVNPAAVEMLCRPDEGLIGESLSAISCHSHNERECSPPDCEITASIRDGMEHRGTDAVFRPPGRISFPVEFVSTPKIENGRVMGAVVIFRDITEVKQAQARMEASLKEKEALLREIHHRVKNNLQIVCSLLNLNSRAIGDPDARRVIEDTRHRVKAMALVHETLYRSGDLAGIDFSEYVPRLAGQLLHSYGLTSRQVQLTLDVESVVLPVDIAIPCALMLTELISNAAKHVFTVTRRGELRIRFCRAEGSWLLRVQNSGRDDAPACPPGSGSSFGLELVRLLTEQLDGSVHFEYAPDFCVSILFPQPETIRPDESRTA
jgi:PAS domain S-box-containing protein